MPFKSEAQRRLFHVLEQQGKISPAKVREWEHATKRKKSLPYHAKKDKQEKQAYLAGEETALKVFGVN